MYQQDFEMKLAKIEEKLETHVSNIGEEILMEDIKNQNEYLKKKTLELEDIRVPPQKLRKLKTLKKSSDYKGNFDSSTFELFRQENGLSALSNFKP
jgi:hypothetical protein